MNRKILNLAIPNILSNISIPLLSSVDTAVVGHLEQTYYLGAIAVGAMIFNFLYWGFGFLRMGTTGLTAQSYGSGNKEEASLILYRAISVAVVFSVLFILFQPLIKLISFKLVEGSADVEFYAKEYFDIRIWAAPASLSLFAFHGWFLGMQNARFPLIISVFVNILNIILNLSLIYGFGMKSKGVALGTVIAQYSGLGLTLALFFYKYSDFAIKIEFAKILNLEPLKKFFKVNFDIFIRTVCLIFAFTYFTAKSAEMGDEILAVNTILLQLWLLLSYGVDGFAFAAESLVGKYLGRKDFPKLKKVINYTFGWGIGLGVLFSIIYYVFDVQILSIFTDKENLINIALIYFGWTIAAPLVNSFCFVWDGIYIGATSTKAMRNSMLISSFLFFLPIILLMEPHIGNHAVWMAMLGFMFSRGLFLSIMAKKHIYSLV